MSVYIKLATLEYPRHEGDIRNEYPEISEGQTGFFFPCPDTYALVEQTPPPRCNPDTEVPEEIAPELVDGKWIARWIVRPMNALELALEAERRASIPFIPSSQTSGTVVSDDTESELVVEDANAPVETIIVNP